MATTYEKIATTTLGSNASSIDFTSIGSGYTDLRIVFVRPTGNNGDLKFRYNSDTGTNYSQTELTANGSAASSYRRTSQTGIYAGVIEVASSTTLPQFLEIDIFSYAGSTYKTSLSTASLDYNGTGEVDKVVGLWRSTAAITSISIYTSSNNFYTGTTATLYGILKA